MNIFRMLNIYSNLVLTQAKIMTLPPSKGMRDRGSNQRH